LLELTFGANFTNILQTTFCMKQFCAAFMCLQFEFVNFWQNIIGKKLLVKLTTVADAIKLFVTYGKKY